MNSAPRNLVFGSIMGCTLLLAGVSIGSAERETATGVHEFTEINVKRINIVEDDGTIKMVISNKDRFPEPVMDGEAVAGMRKKSSGIIMYNDRGDEMGGLVFGGEEGSVGHGFFFDQDRQDQTLGLVHQQAVFDGKPGRYTGLAIWDRPFDTSIPEILKKMGDVQAIEDPDQREKGMEKLREDYGERHRVFLGRGWDENAVLNLYDGSGRPRLRMTVTSAGDASIEFLDENGTVTQRITAE